MLISHSKLSIALAEGDAEDNCDEDAPGSDSFVSICNSSVLTSYTHTVVGYSV